MARKSKKAEPEQTQAPEIRVPIRFEELIGHGAHLHFIGRSLERGALPQSLLLTGPASVGKTTLARMVGAAMQCESPAPGACGACGPCRKAERMIYPDLKEVHLGLTDKGRLRSEIVVDQIRDEVLEPLSLPPYEGKRLVILIEPADALNLNAQNALLKSLEEPPTYAQFFLITA